MASIEGHEVYLWYNLLQARPPGLPAFEIKKFPGDDGEEEEFVEIYLGERFCRFEKDGIKCPTTAKLGPDLLREHVVVEHNLGITRDGKPIDGEGGKPSVNDCMGSLLVYKKWLPLVMAEVDKLKKIQGDLQLIFAATSPTPSNGPTQTKSQSCPEDHHKNGNSQQDQPAELNNIHEEGDQQQKKTEARKEELLAADGAAVKAEPKHRRKFTEAVAICKQRYMYRPINRRWVIDWRSKHIDKVASRKLYNRLISYPVAKGNACENCNVKKFTVCDINYRKCHLVRFFGYAVAALEVSDRLGPSAYEKVVYTHPETFNKNDRDDPMSDQLFATQENPEEDDSEDND
ncbi:hypothetical protein B0T17DRAFT_545812 [Bombardia bombarda]|uniref:Uncharacterized protein n=1 Tax=Bombardia bombarda TaxID=252184 RepID=A0AA39WCF7_9PEZI|nr:hypothetical protein B0T17DRAFT_545812 [Bombardia bombarda]